MRPKALSFATFWAGSAFSGYEAACISSYLSKGYEFTVYSYGDITNLPEGALHRPASDITDIGNMQRFLINGKPNLSHFSDLFRYELFAHTDHIWCDADMMMLRPIDLTVERSLLAKEDPSTLCGAIMRLDGADPHLATLVKKTLQMRDRDLVWGATGPNLLTSVFGRSAVLKNAHDPSLFFPVHYDESWKLMLPEYRDECTELCKSAYTLHLWNDRVLKIGIWKSFAPPAGSFLGEWFRSLGCDSYFTGSYPVDVMKAMVENWRMRCLGGDIGLGQWIRRAVPSAKLTYRRHFNLPT
jgi:hypothetical protein